MRGLLVGRFQPFHSGHLAVLEELRKNAPKEQLLLGVGSAQISHTPENPFSAAERMEMILRALDEAHLEGILPIPLLDIDRHGLWVAYLSTLLPKFERVYTSNPLTKLLFETAGYPVVEVAWKNRDAWEGTRIRAAMVSGGDWRRSVPASVATYLGSIRAEDRLRILAAAPRPPSVRPAP